jgi:hypothetical protein
MIFDKINTPIYPLSRGELKNPPFEKGGERGFPAYIRMNDFDNKKENLKI